MRGIGSLYGRYSELGWSRIGLAMREDDGGNWFTKWQVELPPPEELTPLTQSLITPDLALAFDIGRGPSSSNNSISVVGAKQRHLLPSPPPPPQTLSSPRRPRSAPRRFPSARLRRLRRPQGAHRHPTPRQEFVPSRALSRLRHCGGRCGGRWLSSRFSVRWLSQCGYRRGCFARGRWWRRRLRREGLRA